MQEDVCRVYANAMTFYGLPQCLSSRRICLQCKSWRRRGFDTWVRKIPWRRAWQPIPVFLSGKSHGQRRLEGYSPQGCRVGHDWNDLASTWHFVWDSSNREFWLGVRGVLELKRRIYIYLHIYVKLKSMSVYTHTSNKRRLGFWIYVTALVSSFLRARVPL